MKYWYKVFVMKKWLEIIYILQVHNGLYFEYWLVFWILTNNIEIKYIRIKSVLCELINNGYLWVFFGVGWLMVIEVVYFKKKMVAGWVGDNRENDGCGVWVWVGCLGIKKVHKCEQWVVWMGKEWWKNGSYLNCNLKSVISGAMVVYVRPLVLLASEWGGWWGRSLLLTMGITQSVLHVHMYMCHHLSVNRCVMKRDYMLVRLPC
jgi:hypothetical protein